MAFDQTTRNRLARFVSETRLLLVEEFTRQLQNEYGLDPNSGVVADLARLEHLDDARCETARLLRETMEHYLSSEDTKTPAKEKKARQDVLDRIVREQAFTILNRLCALRMAEARGLLIESVGKGYQSKGFQLYQRLAGSALGETGACYRQFILSLFDEFAVDLPVLFDRFSPQGRLFPRETALLNVLREVNHPDIDPLWAEDETIGWIYQYFNQKLERDAMRKASRSPRNSREMAVRNQFFTPRYVVEFLTDNTLGRIWYEMTKGESSLEDSCRYLVRRPKEIFLTEGEAIPEQDNSDEDLSQEELLNQPVYILHRPLKDPRDIKMLDPACGSMHFGLYAFDLFERIYEEAWEIEEQRGEDVFVRTEELKPLHETFVDKEEFLRDVPRLIIERNIHGIDIDPRAVQIAVLTLWLRAQRSWQLQNVKALDRPRIQRSNIVCAEPMPGETGMLKDFADQLQPKVLGQLVYMVFERMTLAGEAGSLLKIEDELKDVVAKARQQWEAVPSSEQQFLFAGMDDLQPKQQLLKFDVAGITDKRFWEQAEDRIMSALKKYAEVAENGNVTRRTLFAKDTVRGFAFIDLCRNRYDAILMNPPFGASSRGSKEYIDGNYPKSKGDVLANFIERTLQLITDQGRIGAISSRTPFFLGSFDSLRTEVLGKDGHVRLLADLGEGVLEAMVETAIYVITKQRCGEQESLFFRLLIDSEKGKSLQNLKKDCLCGNVLSRTFIINPKHFETLRGNPYAYWVSKSTIGTIAAHPPIEGNRAAIRVGLQTGEDFRHLRLLWEIPNEALVPRLPILNCPESDIKGQCLSQLRDFGHWVPYSKTDVAAPWYSPITLAANWWNEGKELKNFTDSKGKVKSRPQNEDYYFRPGFSYMLRSTRLVPYLVPSGTMPTAGRSQIFPDEGAEYTMLGVCASNIGSAISRLNGGKFTWPTFQASMVQRLPACEFPQETLSSIKKHVDAEVNKRRAVLQHYEPYQEFLLPAWIHSGESGETSWDLYSLFGRELDEKIAEAYGLNSKQFLELERDIREAISIRDSTKNYESEDLSDDSNEGDQELNIELVSESPRTKAVGLLMYAIGVAFGRWDVRIAIDPSIAPNLPAPFDPLPVCPPGMLVGPDGLPARTGSIVSVDWIRARPDSISLPDEGAIEGAVIPDSNYPLSIAWNGILVDDSANSWDIVRRLRIVFELLFGNQCESVESQLSSILGVRSLRDYVRKSSGFFSDHLNVYSKSRRYSPIYWPLSTPSGSYTIWLYYHRLSGQTLYMCVNDFVDPKLKQVADHAVSLRSKRKRSATEEKELERLSNLELELKDFREELLRIARFWKPNLNDGVQITAAPLWNLFQHRQWSARLKETWDKLEAGEYDWAHLALSIWPDRVVRASHKDRSYAIAHDLEDQLWHEVEVERVSRSGRVTRATEWQPRDLSSADLQRIIAEVKAR